MNPPVAPPANILVIRRRYLGDLILITPVLANLKAHWPAARLTLLCDTKFAGVLAGQPNIDAIWTLPDSGWPKARLVAGWAKLLTRLRAAQFDAVIDLNDSGTTARLTRWSGARLRAGYAPPSKAEKRRSSYTHLAVWTPQDHETLHISQLHLKTLANAGVPIGQAEPKYLVNSAARAATASIFEGLAPGSLPIVVLHPGARAADRRWPAPHWAQLADRLVNLGRARVLLLAGPGEEAAAREVASHMTAPAILCPTPGSVGDLAAQLASCDLFIGNDSGPMHVAAAVGTRVIAIFGAQRVSLWRPWGSENLALQASMPCPCPFGDSCQPPDSDFMKCVRRISVEEVETAALGQLVAVA